MTYDLSNKSIHYEHLVYLVRGSLNNHGPRTARFMPRAHGLPWQVQGIHSMDSHTQSLTLLHHELLAVVLGASLRHRHEDWLMVAGASECADAIVARRKTSGHGGR